MRRQLLAASVLTAVVVPLPGRAQTVTITAADCAQFVRHIPAQDVAYTPGVDVLGRTVAPADLDGGVPLALPEAFSIPISVDLQQRLGIPTDPTQFQTRDFTVGVVTWHDGQGFFNGQPLQSEESARLSALCQERLGNGR